VNLPVFKISKPATWVFAADKPAQWKGIPLCDRDTSRQLTETDIVQFFQATFAFLERDGKYIPYDEKIKAVKTILNRMIRPPEKRAINRDVNKSLLAAAMAKMKAKEAIWGDAVIRAKAEFENRGINDPDDDTPGYRERVNELFQEIYSTSPVNDRGKWAEDWFKKYM
jgi:hypothetical protein